MQSFYQDVIGLELMRRFDAAAFFRIADGFAGHTAILALFARGTDIEQEQTPLDHLAFTIALDHYEAEKARLEGLGLDVLTAEHDWVRWRSLYVNDPEGNVVELVCFDETVGTS
jgi:catechol 2,3-dioxygenase